MRRVFANNVSCNERLEFAGRVEDLQHAIFGGGDVLNLPAESWAIEVAEADGVGPADLVAIAGANATASCADVFAVGRVFVERSIFSEVPGKDHVCAIADPQIIGKPGAAFSEFIELLDYTCRINHD